MRHFNEEDGKSLRIELLSNEVVKTSAIEGEMLDRLSVQSSLRRDFGLDADNRAIRPQERGIADMMIHLFDTWSKPLDHETLFHWHSMLMAGNSHLATIGGYRTHEDAMRRLPGRYSPKWMGMSPGSTDPDWRAKVPSPL